MEPKRSQINLRIPTHLHLRILQWKAESAENNIGDIIIPILERFLNKEDRDSFNLREIKKQNKELDEKIRILKIQLAVNHTRLKEIQDTKEKAISEERKKEIKVTDRALRSLQATDFWRDV